MSILEKKNENYVIRRELTASHLSPSTQKENYKVIRRVVPIYNAIDEKDQNVNSRVSIL